MNIFQKSFKYLNLFIVVFCAFTLVACASGNYKYQGDAESIEDINGINDQTLASCQYIGERRYLGAVKTGNKKIKLLSQKFNSNDTLSREEEVNLLIESLDDLTPLMKTLNDVGYLSFLGNGYSSYQVSAKYINRLMESKILPEDSYPLKFKDEWVKLIRSGENSEINQQTFEIINFSFEKLAIDLRNTVPIAYQAYYIKNHPESIESICTSDYRDITPTTQKLVTEKFKCDNDLATLISAIWLENWSCANQILDSGVPIEFNTPLSNYFPHTPLTALTCFNLEHPNVNEDNISHFRNNSSVEILQKLLKNGSDPALKITRNNYVSPLKLWPLKCGHKFNRYGPSDDQFSKYLIQTANLEEQIDETDLELISYVSSIAKEIGRPDLASVIKFDVNSCKTKANMLGLSYLADAVDKRDLNLVLQYLEDGADPNYLEPECSTPLIFHLLPNIYIEVNENAALDILDALIEYGIDLRAKHPSNNNNLFEEIDNLKKGYVDHPVTKSKYKRWSKDVEKLVNKVNEYY